MNSDFFKDDGMELLVDLDVTHIVVTEKQCIFRRLAEDKLWNRFPCIIVTGMGQPDYATRWFLSKLSAHTNAKIVGLFDWNPCGFLIFRTYRIGSSEMGCDNANLVANVKWLGLRFEHVKKYVVTFIFCIYTYIVP